MLKVVEIKPESFKKIVRFRPSLHLAYTHRH